MPERRYRPNRMAMTRALRAAVERLERAEAQEPPGLLVSSVQAVMREPDRYVTRQQAEALVVRRLAVLKSDSVHVLRRLNPGNA